MKAKNKGIQFKTISEQVYNELLSQIISMKRPPRQKLTEGKISKEFGVSRVPVREALSRLTSEGLVKSTPRYGRYVNELTIDEVKEIFMLRQVLEPIALRWGMSRINRKEIQRIKNMLDNGNALNEIRGYNLMLKADEKIHYLIRHYSGNKLLEETLQQLDYKCRPLLAFDAVELDRMTDLIKERKKILGAIIRQDGARAEGLLRTHIKNGEISIITKMKNKAYKK